MFEQTAPSPGAVCVYNTSGIPGDDEIETLMKKIIPIAAFLAIFAGGLTHSDAAIDSAPDGNAASCDMDGTIDPVQRARMDATAMKFVQAILASDVETAQAMMTLELRGTMSPNALAAIHAYLLAFEPLTGTDVSHTYLVKSTGTGPETRTICGTLSEHEGVAVATRPGLIQAHVLIASHGKNNDLASTVWLLPGGDGWQVQLFNMGVSTIVGMTPEMLLDHARAERDSGHPLNAALLYVGAQFTADRGPAFQLGVAQALRGDLEKFPVPAELAGKPPFTWTMQGQTYSVAEASIIGVAGQLGLSFNLPQATWKSDQDAAAKSRDFLKAFIATHPDYAREFHFLVGRALKPDNSGGFATVYSSEKGFL